MVVGGGSVTGGAVVEGTKIDVVGASVVEVVSGGGEVVAGAVVWGGGLEVAVGGRVVFTGGWVTPVPPEGMVTTELVGDGVVVDPAMVDEVEGPLDVVTGRAVVVAGPTVVDEAWVATCCLGEVSLPAISSTSRAARATAAMA